MIATNPSSGRLGMLSLSACLLFACDSSELAGSEGADFGDDEDRGPETDDSAGDGGPSTGLPCDVDAMLRDNCRGCHGDPLRFGAPMPLVTYDDLLVPAVTDLSRPVYDLAAERIQDPQRPMPPNAELNPADRDVLLSWIDAGVPRHDGPTCDGPGGDGGTGGEPDELPCKPDFMFRAHAPGDVDTPFPVPLQDDVYMCFTFPNPFPPDIHGTAWGPVLDDERVVHHWILYASAEEVAEPQVGQCEGIQPSNATFVAGWAPGGENHVYPDDIGLELQPGGSLILQVHYNNTAGHADAADRSGAAFCTGPKRPQTVAVFTLGAINISIPPGAKNHTVVGNCSGLSTLLWSQPVNILSHSPHMHELGRHMKTEIVPFLGQPEIILDQPFVFENQIAYPHDPPVVVQPGEGLRVTCTYDNPGNQTVTFGEGTSDEMCFDFMSIYPIEALPEGDAARECFTFG